MGDGWSKYTTETATALTEAALAIIALQKAYNERARFVSISQLPEAQYLDALPSAFCPAYDNRLDTLIPYFGRIVDGVYVAYTVSSIYAGLGETRLDSRAADYPFAGRWSAQWLEQVIRVINKLILCYVRQDINIVEVNGLRPRGQSSSGAHTGAYSTATNFDDAVAAAWSQANSAFSSNIINSEITNSNIIMEINCFTIGGNAWDSWRGRSLLSLTCAAFNSFGNNLLYSGQQLFAKWNFTASGRTRKPLTAELLGVSSLTEISHNNTSETYECHTVYTADAGGNILALPPWGSFGFPFELETDPADGYAESWLRGGAVGFYGGSFVFIHGS